MKIISGVAGVSPNVLPGSSMYVARSALRMTPDEVRNYMRNKWAKRLGGLPKGLGSRVTATVARKPVSNMPGPQIRRPGGKGV